MPTALTAKIITLQALGKAESEAAAAKQSAASGDERLAAAVSRGQQAADAKLARAEAMVKAAQDQAMQAKEAAAGLDSQLQVGHLGFACLHRCCSCSLPPHSWLCKAYLPAPHQRFSLLQCCMQEWHDELVSLRDC